VFNVYYLSSSLVDVKYSSMYLTKLGLFNCSLENSTCYLLPLQSLLLKISQSSERKILKHIQKISSHIFSKGPMQHIHGIDKYSM